MGFRKSPKKENHEIVLINKKLQDRINKDVIDTDRKQTSHKESLIIKTALTIIIKNNDNRRDNFSIMEKEGKNLFQS